MKTIKLLISFIGVLFIFFISSCSCSNDDSNQQYLSKIEEIAKNHALQLGGKSLSGMQIQQKLFEVRAYEQELRSSGLNNEANFFIKSFTQHLDSINPELSTKIKK